MGRTVFAPFFTTIPEPMKLPRMEKRAAQNPNRRKTCPFIRKVTRAAILEARLMHLVFPEAVRTSDPGKACEDQYQDGAWSRDRKAVIGPDDKAASVAIRSCFSKEGQAPGYPAGFFAQDKEGGYGKDDKKHPLYITLVQSQDQTGADGGTGKGRKDSGGDERKADASVLQIAEGGNRGAAGRGELIGSHCHMGRKPCHQVSGQGNKAASPCYGIHDSG